MHMYGLMFIREEIENESEIFKNLWHNSYFLANIDTFSETSKFSGDYFLLWHLGLAWSKKRNKARPLSRFATVVLSEYRSHIWLRYQLFTSIAGWTFRSPSWHPPVLGECFRTDWRGCRNEPQRCEGSLHANSMTGFTWRFLHDEEIQTILQTTK